MGFQPKPNPCRGDIFYICEGEARTCGSEQRSGRPGVIVSNDINNRFSATVEIVYCTTKEKRGMPTHVPLKGLPVDSTAICEQITTVDVRRLGRLMGFCSRDEMKDIETALQVSLGLIPAPEKIRAEA